MNTELTYIRCGDYFIPNLKLETTEERPLNKYGRMRRTFLREHRPIEYSILAMEQKLFPHLWETQETAQRRAEPGKAGRPRPQREDRARRRPVSRYCGRRKRPDSAAGSG